MRSASPIGAQQPPCNWHCFVDDVSLIVLTNLEDADPERIARRVTGVLRDELRTPDPHPIADTEPQRRVVWEQFLQRARTGTLKASRLPHVRGGFSPTTRPPI